MIGNRIKEARSMVGLSQTEMAEMISVSKQTLYKYENGIVTNIPSDKIERIALICGVSPAYLMGWEETTAAASAVSMDLTEHEAEHIRRYRYISEEGRRRIDAALNLEYDMLAEQKGNVSSA